jgi:hypothetical protein
MSLADYQRAFADLIATPILAAAARRDPISELGGYDLTAREQARLSAMIAAPAMSLNCTLYRVNRMTPIYPVLRRTCELLGDALMDELGSYWAATPETSLQFGPEAARFARWLRVAARLDC